jgi:cation transport ATPase
MYSYARRYIQRAYSNYKEFKATNMETLIALGCISASGLALFFLARYTIESMSNTPPHIHRAIMDINDALTSASVVVLVVTIGKHVEKKAKNKIQKMTDELFPESVLFHNLDVIYVEIKNRNLIILSEKVYDVGLVEKNDILRLQPGKLLVDTIVINGHAMVTQSASTGSEEVVKVGKGERIESGATVHTVDNCLVMVENVLEKSLLIELVTHVKFAQNEEEG